MGLITLNEKTNISKLDIDFTKPNQTLIIGWSGSGKTILAETLLHRGWKQGCVIISLTDVKDEFELAFAQFPIEEEYHKQKCAKWGIIEEQIPVKIYHPFTFNIPEHKLPEIEFYTIPIKSLTRTELSYIAETSTDKTSIKMFLEAIQKLKKSDGLHHLIWEIQKMTEEHAGKQKYSSNPEEFYARGSKGGTEKQVTEIFGYFNPFKKHYTLTPEDCQTNIDIKKIINDTSCYHMLSTKWITDPKMKVFYILNFARQIADALTDYAKHPVIIYKDELAVIAPDKTEGHTIISSEYFGDMLKLIRSKGRGTSSIGCGQEYFKISRDLTGSYTQRIFGSLSIEDINNINRAINIRSEGIHCIRNLKTGQFVSSNIGFQTPFKSWMPPHQHKEVQYKYIEQYQKYYPEKMRRYSETKQYIKEIKNRIEQEVLEEVKKANKKYQEEQEEKQQKKEQKTTDTKAKIEQLKKDKQELTEERKKLIYEKYKEYQAIGTPKSYRALAEEFGIYLNTPDKKTGQMQPNAVAIQRIIEKMEKNNEEKK